MTVTLNIGGEHFVTTMDTIRRVPDTFWSVYFGGNFAQHILADGSHFIDRNAEHFHHVLTFMRDGILTVCEIASTVLLRAVKREFEFYGIDVIVDVEEKQEIDMFIGGNKGLTNVEQFMMPEKPSSQMSISRKHFGEAVIGGNIYVTGGIHDVQKSSSMEIFSHETNLWSAGPPMTLPTAFHVLVAVGQDLYNIGGLHDVEEMVVMKFDSRNETWHLLHTEPPIENTLYCAVSVVGTIIYLFDTVDNVLTLDTVTEVWYQFPAMPLLSSGHESSASVWNGLIYIVGPYGLTCFDPGSGVSAILAQPLFKRKNAFTFVLDGVLHVAGGSTSGYSVERYSVPDDSWEMVTGMKEERSFFYAVTMSRSYVVQKDIFEVLIERSLRQELRATLANDTELVNKMRDEVLAKISAEMHVNTCDQWRSDVYAQMNADHAVLAEIRTEIRTEIRARVYNEVYEELRTEIRSVFDVI
jgi:hypothetical protein